MSFTSTADWSLHPQLAQDSVVLGDLPLSRVLVANDATYPWLILVPRRGGAAEIIDLDAFDRAQLMNEIAHVSTVLREVTDCDKLNVAALGNVVAQLHVHIIARRRTDPAWPKPIWGVVPPKPYTPQELKRTASELWHAIIGD